MAASAVNSRENSLLWQLRLPIAPAGALNLIGAARAITLPAGVSHGIGFTREDGMDDHIYRVIQIVGSSDKSVDDAIQRAVSRASQTLRNLRWFEVVETRGHIEDGKVQHYQVTLKIGFTIADAGEA